MSARIVVALFLLAASAFGQSTAEAPSAEATHYPKLIRADLPLYPPLARYAQIGGTVEIQVTVEKGAVVDAQVKSSSSPFLSNPTMANVKTWEFQSEARATFVVTYVYQLEGKKKPLPENENTKLVELNLPRLVKIRARPLQGTCSDCVSTEVALPVVGGAAIPLYPPLARAAHVQGAVHVKITTNGDHLIAAQAEDGPKLLAAAAEENARTWKFFAHAPATFTVTYHYKLVPGMKGKPDNPEVVMRLPTEVEVRTLPMPPIADPSPDRQ
jgi:TonB family protein